ncbi:uncharacterized protein LOC143603730 [Bidens hawaiensis]|uniref:uncharacterized protein LOC143603730 n=1 Tax=Bidens hawaiensis TaxID=980011 RepID=UPI00404A0BF2
MKGHMRAYGFCRTYTEWIYHGESLIPPVVIVDEITPTNNMADVIEDVMNERREEDTNVDDRNSGSDSSDVRDDFEELLKEAQSELYPGCTKFSSLDFLAKLMHIKVKNKWTNCSLDELFELLQSLHPEGNKILASHYEAKKTLKKIGMGYESINVCKNDCALFWAKHQSLQNCPVCNESRWVDTKTKGKKVPHKATAKEMIWHSTERSEDDTMRHPVDGSSWKEFDKKYLHFSREPRNVRLGLAVDGFNPFGNMSLAYSTWPVVLTTYNLPPWLCMKESSFMLSLLIPGPKSPGKDMDVFLKPLVCELKHLWQEGVLTKDAATNTFFTMKAVLLWTINDFPARSSLSGWSGQGYKACPTCNEDTPSMHVTNKVVYVGHRRFLHANHAWRKSLDFKGEPETRSPPKQFSAADIEDQLSRLLYRVPGKQPDFGGAKRKREDFELNWNKQSIFFELEYWSSLQLKHNLDVGDRKLFCQFIKDVKLPDGFGSNISKSVTNNNFNITGLKSHDCHILMQRLLPIGVRGFLTKDIYTPIVDLCTFFKQLCSRTLLVDDMKKAKKAILLILCKLELIYPLAFFDIMVHLVLHLPDEALLEVQNKARPEGSIAEGYVAEEALSFCSMYLRDVQTRFNRPDRNEDAVVEKTKLCACIVNGVRFMVRGRDVERTTQNSEVLAEGVNHEKYYGQVEEIIELCYGNRYSTVLFRCKWFDTRRGVRHDNNITSINTEHEWDKEDQLIFASQVKQVFYIQEPCRGNKNNSHRWVVENVNHRKIWDLPTLNDGRVENAQNVDNDLVEDLDVVHNNSSSNCLLSIDFTQYLLNMSSHVTVGEKSSEVNPPTVTANTLSDDESDNDEDDFEYDTEGSEAEGSEADAEESEGEFD